MLNRLLKFYLDNMLILNVLMGVCLVALIFVYIIFKDKINELYRKNKEIINYVIVGILTTIVSIGSYYLFRFLTKNYIVLSIVSWILSVTFAYFTNKAFVFESKEKNIIREISKFVVSRLFTLGLEVVLMILLVSIMKVNDMVAKIILQFVILVTNYLLSKLFVFKK